MVEDLRRMARARNYFAWQARLVKPYLGRRTVELGCGVGNFTREILGSCEVLAVDSDDACLEILRANLPDVESHRRDLGRESIADLARFRPDSCLLINVLEHVEHDAQAVRDAAELLQGGGRVIILAPAFEALRGPIDQRLGHFGRYSRRSIQELARAARLDVDLLHYVNLVGFFGWWANARLFRREAQSAAQIAIFDRWIVPVLSRVEAAVRPPFGQSLFAVLRKKS